VTPQSATLAASALSRHPDTRTAAHEIAERFDEVGVPTGGILLLFATFHHRAALPEAAGRLRHDLTPTALVGTTAESVIGTSEEVEDGPGLAALSIHLPGVSATPIRFDPAEGAAERMPGDRLLRRMGLAAGDRPPPAGVLLFADPFSISVPPLLDRFARIASAGGGGPPVPLLGGLASGSSQPGGNILLLDEGVHVDGAVGLALHGDLRVDPIVSQGCRPIGRPFVVTAAEGHAIRGLGGRPALEAAREVAMELGKVLQSQLRRGLLVGVAADEHRDRFGRGDFLIRTVVAGNTKSGELLLNDRIRVGRTIQFHVADAATARADLDLLLDAEQLDQRPHAALLFACTSRGRRLFGEPHHDASLLQRRLGPLPLAGFHAAAEIAPVGGRPWLHGHAACVALLRGREAPPPTEA
jgi:small ligand-binding sensory domain FIST